jgi:hypothetical protein
MTLLACVDVPAALARFAAALATLGGMATLVTCFGGPAASAARAGLTDAFPIPGLPADADATGAVGGAGRGNGNSAEHDLVTSATIVLKLASDAPASRQHSENAEGLPSKCCNDVGGVLARAGATCLHNVAQTCCYSQHVQGFGGRY